LEVYRCPGCGLFTGHRTGGPGVPACTRCGGAISEEGEPQQVSLAALEEAIRTAPVPLLVEFWSTACDACLRSALVLDAVAHRLSGAAVVLRVNLDESPEASEAYRILALPTVILFVRTREQGRRVGPVTAREIEAWARGG